jgi:hypothetical protein
MPQPRIVKEKISVHLHDLADKNSRKGAKAQRNEKLNHKGHEEHKVTGSYFGIPLPVPVRERERYFENAS